MQLIENYALQLGQKIDKIYTLEKYYPIIFDKFIVFSPFSKPSKNYDNWSEVLSLIYPILEKNNIKILQVGSNNETPLPYCYNTQGTTNWGQLQFLISKSQLVLSTDSASAHLAGHYNKNLVVLISNNFSQCVSPYFGDKCKQIILEPDRTTKNPSFMLDEGVNKQVNEIKPEIIASSVCKLLDLEFNYAYKSVFIGANYQNRQIEMVPDYVINISNLGIQQMIVRMDYLFNEDNLFGQLNHCKCSIVTDRPINLQLLKRCRPNIVEIIYNLKSDPELNLDFCKSISELKIPLRLMSFLEEKEINKYKFDLIDIGIIQKRNNKIPENLDLKNLYSKSNRFILSRQKVYSSRYHYINDLPIERLESTLQPIIDMNLEILWEDLEYLYLLEKLF